MIAYVFVWGALSVRVYRWSVGLSGLRPLVSRVVGFGV